MARDNRNKPAKPAEEQQEEMTVVILKFKGSGQTLQKGFDTVTQALAALGPPAQVYSDRQSLGRNAGQLNGASNEGGAEPGADGSIEGDFEEVTEPLTEQQTARAKGGGTGKRHTPKFLSDLDILGSEMPLKGYCAEMNPQKENDKYLVASAWLMKHAGLDTFTANHVFTCFRAMAWKEQKDFTQPMRFLKSKKSYFENAGKGEWKLTSHGMAAAEAIGQTE